MFFLGNVRVGQAILAKCWKKTRVAFTDEFQILFVDFLQNVHVIFQNDKDIQ